MECWTARETISADLDGEADAAERIQLDLHLHGCLECQAFQTQVGTIHRAVRVRVAEPVPDLVPAVLERARPPRVGRGEWIRYSLGLVAATNLALGLPEFLLQSGSLGHTSRHLGAFTVAVSMGLLFAALRPERAYGLLPFAATLGLTMLVGAVIDTTQGDQALLAESSHVLDLLGLALLWLLAGGRSIRLRSGRLFTRGIRLSSA